MFETFQVLYLWNYLKYLCALDTKFVCGKHRLYQNNTSLIGS